MESILGTAASHAVSSLFKEDERDPREDLQFGAGLDLQNQKDIFDYRINRGLEHGMTPYEMFMGPAAGGGGGTSNLGATLGNAASQQEIASKQRNQEITQRALDRATTLQQTKMQTDAQVKTAEISAGASIQNTQTQTRTQQLIANNQLSLNQKTYENVTLPEAAARINKTEAETKKLLNEVATSTPDFVKFMKMLSMGVDNTLSAFVQNMDGYNLVDPESVKKIPVHKRAEILSLMLAIQSGTLKNVKGLENLGNEVIDSQRKQPVMGNQYDNSNKIMRHMINLGG